VAIAPTGTGKTLSYMLPIMNSLGAPASSASGKETSGTGVRAVILAPTKELAHQIHNECLKLAEGRKWRTILFSKATAATLSDKAVRDKVGTLVFCTSLLALLTHSMQTSSSAHHFDSWHPYSVGTLTLQSLFSPSLIVILRTNVHQCSFPDLG
jgi:superfamily II DNA/RNA helicase